MKLFFKKHQIFIFLIPPTGNNILIECPAAIQTDTDAESSDDKFEEPNKALMLCYTRILFSKVFMLIYPWKTMSSTIFELGLAITFGKPILISQNGNEELSYLLREMNRIRSLNVEIVKYNGQIKDI